MFEHEELNGLHIIRINASRMDASNSPEFLALVGRMVEDDINKIAVDFTGVAFMDSSALGATVTALKRVGAQGSLTLIGVSGLVEDLFKLTRMDRIFSMVATVEEARMPRSA